MENGIDTIYCKHFGEVVRSVCKNNFSPTNPSCKGCPNNPQNPKPIRNPKKKPGIKKKTAKECDPLGPGTHQGYIAEYNQRMVACACFLEIIALEDSNPQALTDEHRQVARKIRSLLEREYQIISQEFLRRCRKGDKSLVGVVLDALHACGIFNDPEPWFVEGINALRAKKVKVDVKVKVYTIEDAYKLRASGVAVDNIRRVKNRRKWAVDLYDEAQRIERSLKKKTTLEVFGFGELRERYTERTRYYRDAPRQLQTLYLRYAYLLLHKDLHPEHLQRFRLGDKFHSIPQDNFLPNVIDILDRTWLDQRLVYLQKIS